MAVQTYVNSAYDFRKKLTAGQKLLAVSKKQPVEKIREYYNKNNLLERLKAQVVFEKTLDLILNKAKITEVKPKTKK